jgi:hypothetical protein
MMLSCKNPCTQKQGHSLHHPTLIGIKPTTSLLTSYFRFRQVAVSFGLKSYSISGLSMASAKLAASS